MDEDIFDGERVFIARFDIPEEETIAAIKRDKAYVMIKADKQGYPGIKRYRLEWN